MVARCYLRPMGRWARDELEAAFEHNQAEVRRAGETGNWNLFADLFTEDATYVEHVYGEFDGRDAISDWIVTTMTTPPGSWMPSQLLVRTHRPDRGSLPAGAEEWLDAAMPGWRC